MFTRLALLGAAPLVAVSQAAVVSGRDALPYVNHFIGTNDGSRSTVSFHDRR